MSFEPELFTHVGSLVGAWVIAAVALLSFLGARRVLRGRDGRRIGTTLIGAVLTFVCVVSTAILLSWIAYGRS